MVPGARPDAWPAAWAGDQAGERTGRLAQAQTCITLFAHIASCGASRVPELPADLAASALLTASIALVAGLSRGFSGFGAAMVFIPLTGAALGPVVAVPVLLIADFATSGPLFLKATRICSWSQIRAVALGGFIGFPIGVQILTTTDPIALRWTTSVLILLMLAILISGWKYRGPESSAVSAGVGGLAGLMSGIAQIGGPPLVIYWLGTDPVIARVRANLQVYFGLTIALGLTIFVWKGLITWPVIVLAAATAPSYAAGIYVGARLFRFADERIFRIIAYVLVTLAAVTGSPLLDPVLRGGAQ